MKTFIRLTEDNEERIFFAIDNIASFSKHTGFAMIEGPELTCISLISGPWYLVKETPDQIWKKIVGAYKYES